MRGGENARKTSATALPIPLTIAAALTWAQGGRPFFPKIFSLTTLNFGTFELNVSFLTYHV